jgi:hypothetical protein
VAEDQGGPPLPRRVPGTKRGPGTGPLTRPELSDSDLQRIRAALASAQAQASAPPVERPTTLPRRVPDVGNESEPPARTARPAPAALLPTRRKKTPTEPPPAVPAPRPSQVTEETKRQPEVTADPGPAAAAAAGPRLVPAQRALSGEREEQQDHPDEEKASPEPAPAATQPSPPKPAQPKSAPPTAPASPPAPARPRKRGRGHAIITGSAIAALVLLSAGSSALLLTRHSGPARTRPHAITGIAVRDRAAAWVASQVGRARLVSCDQKMCQALQARGVPANDLLVLRPGAANPLRSAVVVVTAAVRKMMGSRLTADAPATLASFGSGAGRISVRMIYRRGATAYATALRQEIADRKTFGASLLLLDPVTAAAADRRQLRGGQVDSRLLLTLAKLASQWPISIVAFGDRGPGASPGVPLRSADLVVTGGKAGLAPAGQVRLMSVFVHQLGEFFAGARIQIVRLANGQDVVRIEFTAPSRFGLLGTPAP